MSMVSQVNDAGRQRRGVSAGVDDDGQAGTYLTDGFNLYRLLGPAAAGGALLGIEDCRSLDVVFVSRQELRSRRLRPVIAGALA